jgi:hypothetical protein
MGVVVLSPPYQRPGVSGIPTMPTISTMAGNTPMSNIYRHEPA